MDERTEEMLLILLKKFKENRDIREFRSRLREQFEMEDKEYVTR